MTFIFEDGTHLEIEAPASHDFIKHDLYWTVQVHGELIDISNTRASADKIRFISGKVKSVLDLPIRKCSRSHHALKPDDDFAVGENEGSHAP